MSATKDLPFEIEPERYELRAGPAYHFETDRRDFFKFLGAGLLVVMALKATSAAQESGSRSHAAQQNLPKDIAAWLHIGENGKVTVYTGKVEVGQNIRTSLSQGVAEELHYPIDEIELVMGDTQLTPFDMGTFGSRTTPTMNLQLRKVAAAACSSLIGLAAARWQIEPAGLLAQDGKIIDPQTKRSVEYADLVKGKQLTQNLPAEDPLIPAAQWRIAGQSAPKVDGRVFVTGKHEYPIDQKLPDMLHGKIVRPDSFGASLESVDTSEAEKLSAVTVVRDGDFIGVAASDQALATQAAAAVRANWKPAPQQPSNADLFDFLKKHPARSAGPGPEDFAPYVKGSVEHALKSAHHRLQQTYTVAYIAHAPLEPRVALAQWSGDKLTVWTGTQRPFGVRGELAEAFEIPEENVRVIMLDTGSAYGGKHTGEAAVEAARLARAAKRPVKLQWSREEEFTWAYFRPAGVMDITAGMSSDGSIAAWEFHNYNSGGSGINTCYDVLNQRIGFHPSRSPLRQGSYRGLAATANHFARESFMDELAHIANIDPLALRLKNLKDERLRAVFQAAAEKFGWGTGKTLEGQGFGMGGGFEKAGNVATCAEVRVDKQSGDVRVVRVVTAFECGAIVNPDGLRNQIEGANIMGLGGALFESVKFENGKILNARFSTYRVPRFSDLPAIEVVLLDRKDIPSAGAGETPIVGIAPAIGNAIFNATGVRLRSMPMVPYGVKTI
ncbi:MAG TPA: molybdopterin cofactor-binding domain-containing protein [Candidatus Binatus sp.]|jgi:nicotinate dehydrogenase subunit B|nr:molybdopterin cofactor-binding domain-containing protein [Candidatus Binatus sp.]